MPTPATTGQLRTRIQDMEIGDYIPINFNSSTGRYALGSALGTELPITGLANGSSFNHYFYGVKIDKGLICSDRVMMHTVSWDSLNGWKNIQGNPFDTGNIIPVMTSNTSPSGIADASSIYSATYPAWRAFNGNGDTAWVTANGIKTGWLSYQFPSPKVIKAYAITAPTDASVATQSPKDWTFEAFDSASGQWVVLDSRTNETGWTSKLKRTYLIGNTKAYEKYRINISNNNGATITFIGELEMMEEAGVIRSITGGVAFADVNGSSSTTDKNLGAWPLNNEWDKYVVNFPCSLIQTGKTLDDVFHSNVPCGTWCQDTPVNGMRHHDGTTVGLSTHRVWRGYPGASGSTRQAVNYGNFSLSTSNGTTLGFRPVFEYKE